MQCTYIRSRCKVQVKKRSTWRATMNTACISLSLSLLLGALIHSLTALVSQNAPPATIHRRIIKQGEVTTVTSEYYGKKDKVYPAGQDNSIIFKGDGNCKPQLHCSKLDIQTKCDEEYLMLSDEAQNYLILCGTNAMKKPVASKNTIKLRFRRTSKQSAKEHKAGFTCSEPSQEGCGGVGSGALTSYTGTDGHLKNCTYYNGYDNPSYELGFAKGNSISECCKQCYLTKNCKSIVFRSDEKGCILKARVLLTPRKGMAAINVWVDNKEPPVVIPPDDSQYYLESASILKNPLDKIANCTIHNGNIIEPSSKILATFPKLSRPDCCHQCFLNSECIGFTVFDWWSTAGGRCILQTSKVLAPSIAKNSGGILLKK